MSGNMIHRIPAECIRAVTANLVVLLFACAVFAVVSGAVPQAQAADSVARDARLGGDAERTRFVTVLSKNVKFAVRTLADPYRVIIDLSDVKLNFPKGRGKEATGLITGYRYGRVEPYGVRIILDANGPVLVDKASIWPAQGNQPPRLVVELARTDRKTFLAEQKRQARARAARVNGNGSQSGPSSKHVPKRKRSRNAKRIVVIDPGHGGIDPGTISKSGLKEKDIVLAFSKVLREALAKSGRYDAVLTRKTDTYISLRKRVDIARHVGADLFISLHIDSLPGRYASTVSGATIYTLSEKASDDEAKELAAKENTSDVIAGVELPPEPNDITDILIDLAQRETKNLSVSFAETLLGNLYKKTKLTKKSRKSAGFRVLKAPDVPSILLELGYMTNAEDVRRLQSPTWRKKIAAAITRAVDSYFAKQTARNPY